MWLSEVGFELHLTDAEIKATCYHSQLPDAILRCMQTYIFTAFVHVWFYNLLSLYLPVYCEYFPIIVIHLSIFLFIYSFF